MSTMKIKLSSNESSVRLISLNKDRTHAACYLGNLFIPIVDTNTGAIIHKYDVSNQMVGMHYQPESNNVLYTVDDSFGLHAFDTRTHNKRKMRMNPECENHNVTATALSAENVVAVASTTFGCGISDVRASRKARENPPHVISLFDIRRTQEPITTYSKRHKDSVQCLEFYLNGTDLLSADNSGAVKSFNTKLRDEDNAIRWERYVNGPVTRIGVVNKRILYAIGHEQEVNVFIDVKNKVEILYGGVRKDASKAPVKSTCCYDGQEWITGMLKGSNDEVPLVAVHGVKGENFLSLTGMDQDGDRKKRPFYTYPGHNGQIIAFRADKTRIFTGGADGHLIIQPFDLKRNNYGKTPSLPHHPLTLNRNTETDSDDSDSSTTSDDSSSDDDRRPSTSSSSKKNEKKASKKSSSSSDVSSDSDDEGPSTSTAKKTVSPPKSKPVEKVSPQKKPVSDSDDSLSDISSSDSEVEEKKKSPTKTPMKVEKTTPTKMEKTSPTKVDKTPVKMEKKPEKKPEKRPELSSAEKAARKAEMKKLEMKKALKEKEKEKERAKRKEEERKEKERRERKEREREERERREKKERKEKMRELERKKMKEHEEKKARKDKERRDDDGGHSAKRPKH